LKTAIRFLSILFFLAVSMAGAQCNTTATQVKNKWLEPITSLTLVDLEGYIANPAIRLTVHPPTTVTYPATAVVTSNHTRVYFDNTSTTSSSGSSKTIIIASNACAGMPFYVAVWPDYNTTDETHSMTVTITGANAVVSAVTIPITVDDRDPASYSYNFTINKRYTYDSTGFFGRAENTNVIDVASDNWRWFIAAMGTDAVTINTDFLYVWRKGGYSTTGDFRLNDIAYTGYFFYITGIINTPTHRSGGAAGDKFQRISAVDQPYRRAGTLEIDTAGNYNSLRWKYPVGDESDWQDTYNFSGDINDMQSIAGHEMGHALFGGTPHTNWATWKSGGNITYSPVQTYMSGATIAIDATDHLNGVIDPLSRKGAFGNEYNGSMPNARWIPTKLDLLVLQGVGYTLRSGMSTFSTVSLSGTISAGQANSSFTAALSVSNGIPPFNWTISAGALPPGLSINPQTGVISGTPLQTGTFTFTAKIADNNIIDTVATSAQTLIITPAQSGRGTSSMRIGVGL
jgi:putative Ig domain-containing protein